MSLTKFSKLKPKDEFKDNKKDKILFDNDHVQIIEFEDWSIMKEKDTVVCILFFIETNQFLIRYEYIPTYKYSDGQEYNITVLSGGIEKGESPEKALIREIEEEAGIVIREGFQFEELKPLHISKAHVNRYYPYIAVLNENDYHEIISKGDGSKAESLSRSVKVDVKFINSLNTSDLITDYMLLKLKEYLNIQ